MAPKGEFEVEYFGGPNNPAPCGGVNYSVPYTALPPNDLAPGSVNTHSINGFLCSSPWVANPPFSLSFAANEYVLGTFQLSPINNGIFGLFDTRITLIVTNIAVYASSAALSTAGSPLSPQAPTLLHAWLNTEVNPIYMYPGQAVAFIEVNGVVYFTGLMLTGIFLVGVSGYSFAQATGYVAGRWIAELAGRLVVSQCIFPGGGGTGASLLPTVAWSGVGIYGQAWDGNPAHDVWNPSNQAFFSGNIGGFNLLGDVPDEITGMGTVGQSIIIVRNNGLTQQDPNSTYSNSGIQPFNWYHMWSSNQGVGGYVGTVAQFGQTLYFLSSDNSYTLSLSSGLSAIGNKIIAKIISDKRTIDNSPGVVQRSHSAPIFFTPLWYFASIYQVDGQLHYLITISAYTTPGLSATTQVFTCFGYDLNLSDGGWHFIDFSQYYQQTSAGSGFIGFSCPLVQQQTTFNVATSPGVVQYVVNPTFFLFGAISSYGTLPGGATITGTLCQLVPFNYDFASNPINSFLSNLYVPLSIPSPTLVFRGETLTLGHRIATRRLRLQADNAPLPTILGNSQQQAQVVFTGAGPTEKNVSPTINMEGNAAPTGQAIRTYYGDSKVNAETVQPSLASVFQANNAWQTLCAFRIASASLIGNDATGTTQ